MSIGILEKVKELLVRLVKDVTFRAQLENRTSDECKQVLQDAGYAFSKEEFETATINILELKEQGDFNELSEPELAAVLGGFVGGKSPIIQPMYGVVIWPPIKWPPIQPMYGVVISDQ